MKAFDVIQKVERGFFQFLQSHWDWLPPELQQYVMLFAATQHFIELKKQVEMERQDNSIRQHLRNEILAYGTLKKAWGLGHIQVVPINKTRAKKMKIIGYYREYYELTKQKVYLGHSYMYAYSRMNHVKSFL